MRVSLSHSLVVLLLVSSVLAWFPPPPQVTALNRVGQLTLQPNEADHVSALLDPVRGFLYIGIRVGRVVKVRLSDFSRVGAFYMNEGERIWTAAVIDTINNFAYFGLETKPGKIVKIDLSTFTRAATLTLDLGEDYPCRAFIDEAKGLAYFITETTPPKIVTIRLADFTKTGSLIISSASYVAGDIPNGFAYFAAGSKIEKLRLSDMTVVGTLTLISGERVVSGGVDPSSGFAYFGLSVDDPRSGWPRGAVTKVRLSDLTRVGTLLFRGTPPGDEFPTGEYGANPALFDFAKDVAYFGTSAGFVGVKLSDLTRVELLLMERASWGVVDPVNRFAYIGGVPLHAAGQPSIVKLSLDDVPFDFSLGNTGDIYAPQGLRGSTNITVSLVSGTPHVAFLSVDVDTSIAFGVELGLSPGYASVPFISECSIRISSTVPLGSYRVRVIGTTGALTRTTTFSLNVVQAEKRTWIVCDASPKPGYAGQPVTVSGTMYGDWRCIRGGVVVGKTLHIAPTWLPRWRSVVTDDKGQFTITLIMPSDVPARTYSIAVYFGGDEDLPGTRTDIQYEVIERMRTSITISYVGNREFSGYLRRTDTGAYLAYRPVKLTVTYLSGTMWQTATYDLQTRQDGYYSLEFLFYWQTATIAFEGDETYAQCSATISR